MKATTLARRQKEMRKWGERCWRWIIFHHRIRAGTLRSLCVDLPSEQRRGFFVNIVSDWRRGRFFFHLMLSYTLFFRDLSHSIASATCPRTIDFSCRCR
jgi:hypothetical protein